MKGNQIKKDKAAGGFLETKLIFVEMSQTAKVIGMLLAQPHLTVFFTLLVTLP